MCPCSRAGLGLAIGLSDAGYGELWLMWDVMWIGIRVRGSVKVSITIKAILDRKPNCNLKQYQPSMPTIMGKLTLQ